MYTIYTPFINILLEVILKLHKQKISNNVKLKTIVSNEIFVTILNGHIYVKCSKVYKPKTIKNTSKT